MFRYRDSYNCYRCNDWQQHVEHLLEAQMADLSALTAAVDTTVAALADLAAKVAAGDSTAQGDIDAITAKLVAAVQANDPAPVVPVAGDVTPA